MSKMNDDWKLFIESGTEEKNLAPSSLKLSIDHTLSEDLSPGFARVLGKLGVIHVFTSILTLSVCPQFGVRLFGEGMGLMHFLMRLGEWGCAIACGIFFVGSSVLFAAFSLKRAEWRRIRQNGLLCLTALVLPSIGFFKIMDGEFFLEFSAGWLIGALVLGRIFLEGLWIFKDFLHRKEVAERIALV